MRSDAPMWYKAGSKSRENPIKFGWNKTERFHTGKNDKDGYPLLRGDCFDFILKNIVKKDKMNTFSEGIKNEYAKITGIEPEIYSVKLTDGTGLI